MRGSEGSAMARWLTERKSESAGTVGELGEGGVRCGRACARPRKRAERAMEWPFARVLGCARERRERAALAVLCAERKRREDAELGLRRREGRAGEAVRQEVAWRSCAGQRSVPSSWPSRRAAAQAAAWGWRAKAVRWRRGPATRTLAAARLARVRTARARTC